MITPQSRRSAILLAGASLLLISPVVYAEESTDTRGPFGLTWGMSSDEVRKLGVELTTSSGHSDYGASFTATNLSQVLSDMAWVALFFGYKDKLWRIAAAGRPMGPDPSGSQVVARYQDLAASLSDRYGRGIETDVRDHEVWKDPNEYVMSIRQGRASRYTTFRSPVADVELSIRAEDGDTAFYLILFEYRPGAREFEMEKRAHEKNAL